MADKLHHFVDTNGFPTAGDFPETITPIVERLALRGIDFHPRLHLQVHLRAGCSGTLFGVLGPVFTERADTVGENRVDIGFS